MLAYLTSDPWRSWRKQWRDSPHRRRRRWTEPSLLSYPLPGYHPIPDRYLHTSPRKSIFSDPHQIPIDGRREITNQCRLLTEEREDVRFLPSREVETLTSSIHHGESEFCFTYLIPFFLFFIFCFEQISVLVFWPLLFIAPKVKVSEGKEWKPFCVVVVGPLVRDPLAVSSHLTRNFFFFILHLSPHKKRKYHSKSEKLVSV